MTFAQSEYAMATGELVAYQGINYKVTARIKRKHGLHPYYQLELLDANRNSITIANMEMVQIIRNNGGI